MDGRSNAVSGGGAKFTLTVSATSGAQVTASKGDKVVSGTSTNGEAVLILPEAGEWTVSGTLNGQASGSVVVEVVGDYTAALTFVGSLNDTSWEEISEISTAGTAQNYWSVGDRKQVTLNGTVGALSLSNFSTYAFIIGFNHNSSREGTGRIHFQLAQTALSGGTDICFTDSNYNLTGNSTGFRMNTSNTNSGGWEDSYMRNSICGTSKSSTSGRFMGAIPSALRNVLKSVTKYTDNTGNASTSSSAVTATTDYIFLLSEYEVSGSSSTANGNEASRQQQYAYYSAGNSKVKYRHTSTSSTARWWLRSAYRGSSTGFAIVNPYGNIGGSYSASYSLGVAPGFCV